MKLLKKYGLYIALVLLVLTFVIYYVSFRKESYSTIDDCKLKISVKNNTKTTFKFDRKNDRITPYLPDGTDLNHKEQSGLVTMLDQGDIQPGEQKLVAEVSQLELDAMGINAGVQYMNYNDLDHVEFIYLNVKNNWCGVFTTHDENPTYSYRIYDAAIESDNPKRTVNVTQTNVKEGKYNHYTYFVFTISDI